MPLSWKLFYKYFNTLTDKYEKYVASVVGLSKEEIFQRKRYMPLMLGSEKIYFPDKLNEIYGNTTSLKNDFIKDHCKKCVVFVTLCEN